MCDNAAPGCGLAEQIVASGFSKVYVKVGRHVAVGRGGQVISAAHATSLPSGCERPFCALFSSTRHHRARGWIDLPAASIRAVTDLRRLQYFVTVAQERNFTRAAERLHIAQPALSRQVRLLEQELGVELLYRTTHEFELTQRASSCSSADRRC